MKNDEPQSILQISLRPTATGVCSCANRIFSSADLMDRKFSWNTPILPYGFSSIKSFVFLTHNYFDCSYNCEGCNKSIICESFKCALWFISHTRSLIELQCEIIEFSGSSLSCIDPFFHQMSISHTKNAVLHTYLILGQSKKESRIMCRYQWQWTNRKKMCFEIR